MARCVKRCSRATCCFIAIVALTALAVFALGSLSSLEPQLVLTAALEAVNPPASDSSSASSSESYSGSQSPSDSQSRSESPSQSQSHSDSQSRSGSVSVTVSDSSSVSPTMSVSASMSASSYRSPSQQETPTRTSSPTPTQSATAKGSGLPPFVFVHLGSDPEFFPDFMAVAVRQVARWNPNVTIHVIVPRAFRNRRSVRVAATTRRANVTVWAAEDIPQSPAHVLFHAGTHQDSAWRGGFWKVTTERLFTLSDFLDWRGIYEAVHQENDNLIYFRLKDHISTLRKYYPGLSMTPHASAGFMYVGNRFTLGLLAQTMTNATTDEMLMVGWFQERYGLEGIKELPVIAPGDVGFLPSMTRHFTDFGGIFDGAPHGQFVGGPDPRNGHGGPGFVNPQAPYSTADFEYEWTVDSVTGLRHMRMRKRLDKDGSGEWRRLLHLHIHCKNLTAFES